MTSLLRSTCRRVAAVVLILLTCSPGAQHADATVSQGVVSVNWRSGTVTVRAKLPAGVGNRLVIVPPAPAATAPAGSGLEVVRQGAEVLLRGHADALAAAMTEGTRSLRVRDPGIANGPVYRVDLPPVNVDTKVSTNRFPKITEGLFLSVPVAGLRPGYTVRCNADGVDRQLSTEAGRLPRVSDVVAGPGGTTLLRLVVPFLDAQSPEVTYRIVVVNPDGSRSATLAVSRRGGTDAATAAVVAPARPAPGDTKVVVPAVELLDLAEAQKRVRASGLVPVAVSTATLAPLDAAALAAIQKAGGGTLTVARQGAGPGETLRSGETLLLGVRDPASLDGEAGSDGAAAAQLDAGDDLGFADLGGGSATPHEPLDESSFAEPGEATDGDSSAYLPIGSDPRVWLDPTTPAEQIQTAAIAKLTMDAIVAGLGLKDSPAPGAIGKAVREAVDKNEPELARAIQAGTGAEKLSVDSVLETVLSALRLNVAVGARDEVVKAWRQGKGRAAGSALDGNRNGLYADDVALAMIGGLVRSGRYDPLRQMSLVSDAAGRPAVRFDGGKAGKPGANPLKLGKGAGGGGSGGKKTTAPPAPRIPDGPAQVDESSGPDSVRIPTNLVGQNVKEAARRLDGLALKTADVNSYFDTDQVAGAEPAPGRWVPPATLVALQVQRKTPRVVGQTLAKAQTTLSKWRLGARALDDGPKPTDYVIEQDPAEGRPIQAKGTVQLRLQRPVPDVRGQFAAAGVQKLKDAGFTPRFANGLSRWDRVEVQDPGAGGWARIRGDVRLTVRRPVPDVRGKSFSDLRPILEDYRFEGVVADEVRPGARGVVFDQDPRPGPGPTIAATDDGRLQVIRLTVGQKVPELVGRKLEDAQGILQEIGLREDHTEGFLNQIPMKVMGQDQAAGAIVANGASIRLRVGPLGPLVPPVIRMTLQEAIDRLKSAGLNAGFPKGSFSDDRVVEQDPKPYSPANPSWLPTGSQVALRVVVRVPNLARMSLAEAAKALRAKDLRPNPPEGALMGDRVVGQSPPADGYLPHGSAVSLDLRVLLPDLKRQSLARAQQSLGSLNVRSNVEGRSFEDDVVVDQGPPAGTLVEHGSTVGLRVLVRVPGVSGMSVERAREVLRQRDLETRLQNRLAMPGDQVRGQSVEAGQLVPHGSAVVLGPVVTRMPDVRGARIGQAVQGLRERESFDARPEPGLEAGDTVTGQSPPPGQEVERGSVVQLSSKYQVPGVIRREVTEAVGEIRGNGGNLRVRIVRPAERGDVVMEQQPPPGTWVNPRSTVELLTGFVMPNLIRQPVQMAVEELRRMNVPYEIGKERTEETQERHLLNQVRVARQQPEAGRTVPRGTRAALSVVRFTMAQATVPNMRGWEGGEARAAERVRAAGLIPRFVNREYGIIIDQSLPAGERVPRGTVLQLRFSTPRTQGRGQALEDTQEIGPRNNRPRR